MSKPYSLSPTIFSLQNPGWEEVPRDEDSDEDSDDEEAKADGADPDAILAKAREEAKQDDEVWQKSTNLMI